MQNPRVLIAAGVLALVAVVVVVLVVAGGSDDEDGPRRVVRSKLTLTEFVAPDTRAPELLVNLPEKRLNAPETTGGKTSVRVRCLDLHGRAVINGPTDWPLLEELGYPLPHIHLRLPPKELRDVRSCRLTGPGIDFRGSVSGPPPRATQ